MRLDIFFVAYELVVSLSGVHAEASLDKTIASIWEDFKNAVDCGSCQVGIYYSLDHCMANSIGLHRFFSLV